MDQSAKDLGFYFTDSTQLVAESRYFESVGNIDNDVAGYNMTLYYNYGGVNGDVLSASLEVVRSNSLPTPVPLPPSLPVLASGLLALASVRFASRGARR